MAADATLGILSVRPEWMWAVVMLIMLPAIFLSTGAGRSFGPDAFLAPPPERATARGNRVAWLRGRLT